MSATFERSVNGGEHDAPAANLRARIQAYWNTRLHDVGLTNHAPGTQYFFEDLEEYRFEKLEYLPRVIDFSAHAGRDVLEVGCGLGTDLVRFARAHARAIGVDVSETAIDLARKNLHAAGVSARVLVADGAALPIADASVDVVYCHGVLPYVCDPAQIVVESLRVLRAGGTAVFMAYNRRSWLSWLRKLTGVALEHEDAPVFRVSDRREFAQLLDIFGQRYIISERYPVATRLHSGWKATLFNVVVVPAFRQLPANWTRHLGWHLIAFCTK